MSAQDSLDWVRNAGLLDHVERIVATAPPLSANHRNTFAVILAAIPEEVRHDQAA